MKKIVFMLLCLSSVFRLSAQEQELSLELELVKPSGKLDGRAHFALHLKNTSDSLTVHVLSTAVQTGVLQKVYGLKNGERKVEEGRPIFEYIETTKPTVMIIKPREEYIIMIPTFSYIGGDYPFYHDGMFPEKLEYVQDVKRVRVKLKTLKYFTIAVESSAPNKISEMKTVDFYSNWIDVDIAAFQKILDDANRSKE